MGVVLVTGASTGIGAACVARLSRDGHVVAAGVRREIDGERLVAEHGDGVVPVRLDVTESDDVEAAAAEVAGLCGPRRFVGVVNNAGIALGGPLEYLPLDDWRRQFEVNVLGLVAVTRAVLPLVRASHGRVVLVGSMSGRVGAPLMGPYTASKFAVEGLAACLRLELDAWGVPVTVVEPGAVATPIWEKGTEEADRLERELPAEALGRYAGLVDALRAMIRRSAEVGVAPEVVADAVARALTDGDPPHRIPVGPDARVAAVATRLLPDKVLHRLVLDETTRRGG